LQPRLLVVFLGANRLGDVRVPAVGPDDDASPLDHRRSAVAVSADADHRAVLDEDLVDVEVFAYLGAGLRRGVHEDLVQDGSPRRVAGGQAVPWTGRPADRDRPEVERVALHRWAARRDDAVEQRPAVQCGHAGHVDHVGRQGVARELGAIDQKHPVAGAGEQHRGGRTGTPGAHDDRVVVSRHRSSVLMVGTSTRRWSHKTWLSHQDVRRDAM